MSEVFLTDIYNLVILIGQVFAVITAIFLGVRKFSKNVNLQKEEIKTYIDEKKADTDKKIKSLQDCMNGTRSKVDNIEDETGRLRINIDKIWPEISSNGKKLAEITGIMKTHLKKDI